MGAYNPPDQVLFSPVSNFYQGKAIRQQLATGEQDKEFKGLQIDAAKEELANAPSAREAAKQKALLDAESIQSAIDERYANGEREALRYADEVMKPLFQAYGEEKDENKALGIFNTGLPEALSRLPEDQQEAFRAMDTNGDRVFDHDEIMRAGLARRFVEDKESEIRSARYKQAVDGGLRPGTPEFNEFVLNKGGDSGRQRDDEIKSAEAIFTQDGNPDPHRAAVEFVDKGKQVLMSPTDNTVFEYDKFTEKLTIMKPEDTRGAEPEIPQEQTLYALADEATGIGPGAKAAAAKGLGPLGGYTAEATTTAKAQFLASENSLIEAFRLNPRYPQSEIKRIQSNIDIMPKFWDSAEQMRARMAGSRTFLETELASVEWNLQNPTITAKERSEEETTRRGIKRYLRVLGKPPEDISAEAVKANEGKLASIAEQIAEIDRQIEAAQRGE